MPPDSPSTAICSLIYGVVVAPSQEGLTREAAGIGALWDGGGSANGRREPQGILGNVERLQLWTFPPAIPILAPPPEHLPT